MPVHDDESLRDLSRRRQTFCYSNNRNNNFGSNSYSTNRRCNDVGGGYVPDRPVTWWQKLLMVLGIIIFVVLMFFHYCGIPTCLKNCWNSCLKCTCCEDIDCTSCLKSCYTCLMKCCDREASNEEIAEKIKNRCNCKGVSNDVSEIIAALQQMRPQEDEYELALIDTVDPTVMIKMGWVSNSLEKSPTIGKDIIKNLNKVFSQADPTQQYELYYKVEDKSQSRSVLNEDRTLSDFLGRPGWPNCDLKQILKDVQILQPDGTTCPQDSRAGTVQYSVPRALYFTGPPMNGSGIALTKVSPGPTKPDAENQLESSTAQMLPPADVSSSQVAPAPMQPASGEYDPYAAPADIGPTASQP